MREAIATVAAGRDLDERGMRAVVDVVMSGAATPAQVGSLLTALRMKGESVDELVGTARALRARMLRVPWRGVVVDTCGTGGDGADLFNVSTAVALVVAGAGVAVAKHGNRAQSGRVGGADVLEALGVRIDLPPGGVARCLERAGIGFCFAPRFHAAMRYAAGPRREIGLRTIFNLVGPLANPGGAAVQLVGVSEPRWTVPMAEALHRLGATRALVVHGSGLDEISTIGPTRVSEVGTDGVRTYDLAPSDFGLGRCDAPPRVADAAGSAAVIRAVLAGAAGPARDLVLVNAAATLGLTGLAADYRVGMAVAAAAIDGGAAARALARLVETSNEYKDEAEPV
ncbi:MAG: anthranilate phosphoribosyltransferase [Deltaproteobacteria bacterium]|nr:anthranilate phosphoribosyltransferase [Deltaproteobacteria bacterium]